MDKKLIPYSVHLPIEHYKKLRELAKNRQASSLIRDAVASILDGNDAFTAGYNRAIMDAAEVIYGCKEAQMIAVNGRDLGVVLNEKIQSLRK